MEHFESDDDLIASPRQIIGVGVYVSKRFTPMRPGAEDHEIIPSRMGDSLHYRDGRVEVFNDTND